eukprot:9418123-Prorocentrum_lima.AAC.1
MQTETATHAGSSGASAAAQMGVPLETEGSGVPAAQGQEGTHFGEELKRQLRRGQLGSKHKNPVKR